MFLKLFKNIAVVPLKVVETDEHQRLVLKSQRLQASTISMV
jgi:hypothetical protein